MRVPISILLLLPAFAGCGVYSSVVPLDQPGAAAFDEARLGTWEFVDDGSGDSEPGEPMLGPLVIVRASQHEYDADWIDPEVWERDTVMVRRHARLHVSVLRDVRFLNIFDTRDSTYAFAGYQLDGDVLRLRIMLGDSSPMNRSEAVIALGEHATSDALRAAVLASLDDPRLFEKEEIVLRRRSAPPCPGLRVAMVTNDGPGDLEVHQQRGGDIARRKLLAKLGPGTHVITIPNEHGLGFVLGPAEGASWSGGSRLQLACR
jgi:hypothetical protein